MNSKKWIIAITTAACLAVAFAFGKKMETMKEEKSGVMTPEVLLSLGRLSDPQLSPDGSKILYGVSYIDIEKNSSCRNLFICNADGSEKTQLISESKSISCARWSLDGKSIYFLQGGQMYKAAFKGKRLGRKQKISDIKEGIGEFQLSPDQKKVMYISTIAGPVKSPADSDPKLDKAQAYVADGLMYRHWDHWVTTTPRTYIAPMGSKITPENSRDILCADEPWELPTEPFGGVEQLSWSPDGSKIAYSCRKKMGKEYAFSTNCDIFIYDLESAETTALTCGGGYDTDPAWSPDGNYLAWISMERDGYEADRQRVMLYDIHLGTVRELTEGFKYDAGGLTWLPSSKGLIFPSTINAVGALCYVGVDGAQVVRLTPEEWLCSIGSPFSIVEGEEGYQMLTTCNSMKMPSEIFKISVGNVESDANSVDGVDEVATGKQDAEGKEGLKEASVGSRLEQISHENDHILDRLNTIGQEQIKLRTAQGEDLYCWILYPNGFDGTKKFPVVEMFNGGPQTSLDQSWSYRWNFFMMAQQGYVVLLPNRHGDSGFGQEWKEQISGDYQGLNMQDYMLAASWAKSQAWCGKIAGVGASYGGFSVYNMMGIHGDLYDCFIAHAGIFDEKMMWFTTEESWFNNWDCGGLTPYEYTPGEVGPRGDGITFGGMQQAGAPYAKGEKVRTTYENDPSSRVTSWHTPILCIHGMMDYRIPYEQGMAAFNAAQMMGVPSKLIIFPQENHWIIQPQNALFWHREFFAWLEKWLRD